MSEEKESVLYKGRRIDELDKEELLEAVRYLFRQLNSERRQSQQLADILSHKPAK